MACSCVNKPEMIAVIEREANSFAENFASSFGEHCPEVAALAVSCYVARLGHILVMMEEIFKNPHSDEDPKSMTRDRDTFKAVQDRLKKITDGIQPFVSRAMEYQEMEEQGARH